MAFDQRRSPRRGILMRRVTHPVAILVSALAVVLIIIRAIAC